MSQSVLHQFLAGATAGDAITEQALLMRGWLRDLGFTSEIFAWHIHPDMAAEIQPLTQYRRRRGELWALYHHSIGSDVPGFLADQGLRLVLIYHNITPPEFFEGVDPMRARMAVWGMDQLISLREQTGLALAISRFNAVDLSRAGYSDVRVLPITLPADRYDLPLNSDLAEALQNGGPSLLFIGRLAPNKRQEDLVRLLYCLRRIRPDAHLHLVGDRWVVGYDRWIERLAEQLGVRDGLTLTGKISQKDMVTYLKTVDCYVSMSEHEGFGVPLIESMYVGLPIVAYGAAAVPDTMGQAGIIFYEKEYEALAELIDLLLTDHSLRRRVVRFQNERAQAFLEPQVHRQFVEYLAGAGLC